MTSFGMRAALSLALTAVLAGFGAGPASHAASPSGAAQSLRIAGSGAVYGSVVISRTIDFASSKEPVFRASHPQRLDAIVLIRETAGTSAPGVAALNLQSGSLLQRSYAYLGTDTGDQVSGTPIFATRKLPAGRYRLMMLSRGANDVTLTLPSGKPGVERVRAAATVRYVWQESSTSVAEAAAPPATTAVTTFSSESRILQVGLGWLKSTSAATRFHACSEPAADTIGTALQPTPVCRAMAGVNSLSPGIDRVDVFQAFHQPAAGGWEFKSVASAVGVPSVAGAVSLQVALGSGFD